MLNMINRRVIYCEIGFVDNQTCVNAVNDDEVARAYAAGIAAAYGLKKKENNLTDLYRVRKT